MGKNIKTSLLCYDEYRGFTENIRKQFPDENRYTIISIQARDEFINNIKTERDHNLCKVAILGVHDTKEHIDVIEKLTLEAKRIDPQTGLILICPVDKMDEIKKTIRFNIDAYIPNNANSLLRIHNMVKKMISEHNIGIFRKKRNLSLYVLLAFILSAIVMGIISFFRFPQYF